jgi:hypothetical protein
MRRVESTFYDEVSASFLIIFHIFFCFPQRGPQPRDFGFAPPNYPPRIFFDHHRSFHEATAHLAGTRFCEGFFHSGIKHTSERA